LQGYSILYSQQQIKIKKGGHYHGDVFYSNLRNGGNVFPGRNFRHHFELEGGAMHPYLEITDGAQNLSLYLGWLDARWPLDQILMWLAAGLAFLWLRWLASYFWRGR
jgi:hypothetical protein